MRNVKVLVITNVFTFSLLKWKVNTYFFEIPRNFLFHTTRFTSVSQTLGSFFTLDVLQHFELIAVSIPLKTRT